MSRNNVYSYWIIDSMDIIKSRLDTNLKSKMENRSEDLVQNMHRYIKKWEIWIIN